METLLKNLVALLLLALLGFCAFGFLATFEPNPPVKQWTWRAIYSVLGLTCLWGASRLWKRRAVSARPRRPGPR